MDNELNEAFKLVSQHNSAIIKQGQAKLTHLKKNNFYPIGLLMYMNNNQNTEAQLRAAIELKLWCQSYESMQVFQRNYYSSLIEDLKSKIILAYLSFGGKVSQTIRSGIVSLANIQFPQNWNGLISGLINYVMTPGNQGSFHPVLSLIQEITYKYSYLSRSDPLYTEINLVCDQVHDFLLQMTMNIVQSQNLNDNTLQLLETCMHIFYHLNYQDLHPKFQDNIGNWMSILKTVMNFKNTSENMFKCKGAALESILLYASKYKEDVQESIKGFSSQIWDLCSNATDDPQYDQIVFNCLKYFKSIILWSETKQFFIENMGQLIEKLIMPNLKIDKAKIQMFNEQPENFIDFYFKNNEIHTRRAASLDLLRVICRNFPNFDGYVLNLITNFTNNMQNSSINVKCNLINFIIDGACKNFRDIDGCSETYVNLDYIVQCYEHFIKPDLASVYGWIMSNQNKFIQDEINLILLVTLMRYVYFFRIFISPDNYQLIIKFASSIKTNNLSVKTLVFMITNAFLTVRHGDFQHFRNLKFYFNSQNTHCVAKEILTMIYVNDQSFSTLNQNLTKMLYTLSKILSEATAQYYEYFDVLFKQMLNKTEVFDFKSVLFLFESIGVVAYWVSKNRNQQAKNKLENQIFDYFFIAIKRDSDLLNFCFQILAIFLEFENKNVTRHTQIYESILNPSNWIEENISIMSSYIQYISAFLTRSHSNIIKDREKFSLIFAKLVELEHYDLFFRFLDSILKITGIDQFYDMGYCKISIQGTQAISGKSIAGRRQGIIFIFKLMSSYDVKKVLGYVNNISSNLFGTLIGSSKDIIRTIQSRRDRKFMYSALCNAIMLNAFQNNQMEGTILEFLIDNTTNRFMISGIRANLDSKVNAEKKQATYQKLQIFNSMEAKENALQIDEEQQLCKAYIVCQKQNRSSLQLLNDKNHERMKRLIQKHQKSLQHYLN